MHRGDGGTHNDGAGTPARRCPFGLLPKIKYANQGGKRKCARKGKRQASIPVKCIDQMPKPIAVAPPISQALRTQPLAAVTRPPRSSAAYDAEMAITTERTT